MTVDIAVREPKAITGKQLSRNHIGVHVCIVPLQSMATLDPLIVETSRRDFANVDGITFKRTFKGALRELPRQVWAAQWSGEQSD